MSRDIKFREWDKTRDEMFCEKNQSGIKSIEFSQYGEVNIIELFEYLTDGSFAFKELNKEDVELMQFTGMHDKNGVEIYDGDIVQYNSRAMQVSKVWQHIGGEWQVFDSVKDEILELYMEKKYLTVIGNIYEHKHLLNEGK